MENNGKGLKKVDIIVLLKQVPDTQSNIKIADSKIAINTDNVKWIINPFDEFAIEEALRIRKDYGGSVTVLAAGSKKTAEAIRTALAMGADKGILIDDDIIQKCDGLGIAQILAKALEKIPFDLIIAGQRAVDDDNFLVGAAVADLLNIPYVSFVVQQEIIGKTIRCHRTIEGGTAVIDAKLPVLFTTQKGLNEPRFVSLPGIMKAKKKPIKIKTVADVGIDAEKFRVSSTKIIELKLPRKRKKVIIIEGDLAHEKADKLLKTLSEISSII